MEVRRRSEGRWEEAQLLLPEEVPLRLVVNGTDLVTIMATPAQLRELVVGFLRTSELIDHFEDIASLQIKADEGISEIVLRRPPESFDELFSKRFLTSGCGGGRLFIDPGLVEVSLTDRELTLTSKRVEEAGAELLKSASMYRASGGIHASALFSLEETIFVSEDVGRHNTFDKLIGAAMIEGIDLSDKFVAGTGRLSAEMVAKAARVGICFLISRTSPTTMAAALADALGITIVGYLRRNSFNVYTHPQRVVD